MSKKIGFWSVLAIVTGSQVGSTIFIAPASLAQFGVFSLYGWLISAFGAICLSLVFASLCARFPETGGPHVYVKNVFGRSASFFTGWTYWVVSWVSSSVVVVTAVGSIVSIVGDLPKTVELALQIFLLMSIALLNLRGVKTAGTAEFVLMLLKLIPLITIPILALYHFNTKNFLISDRVSAMPTISILSQVTLLTFFGFVGLESATAVAGEVKNPTKIIPKAIIAGTFFAAFFYILNSVGIMGAISTSELSSSKAPYADVVHLALGGNWYILVSVIITVVCAGSLNAWILASGQIALGLAQDGLMPKKFAQKNSNGAPFFSIIISCLGIVPLLIVTFDDNIATQVSAIIDYSVTAFLFVYLACCISFGIIEFREKDISFAPLICSILATIFCIWIISQTPLQSLIIASLFVVSGSPMYLYIKYKNKPKI